MLKKIILAAVLAASASFAAWDKFPVLNQGQGQVRLGFDIGMHKKWSDMDLSLGARYTVIQNLEIMANLPYRLWGKWDGNDRGDGLGDPTIGVRYFFPMNLGLFLDLDLPVGNDDYAYQGFGFHFGAQYAKVPLTDKLSMGSELGLSVYTEGDDDYDTEQGTEFFTGVEFDYDLGSVKPYIGLDYVNRLTDTEVDATAGNDKVRVKQGNPSGYQTTFGLNIPINQVITIEGKYVIQSGAIYDYGYNYIIAANIYFNF